MGERTTALALANATKCSVEDVAEASSQLGDLGLSRRKRVGCPSGELTFGEMVVLANFILPEMGSSFAFLTRTHVNTNIYLRSGGRGDMYPAISRLLESNSPAFVANFVNLISVSETRDRRGQGFQLRPPADIRRRHRQRPAPDRQRATFAKRVEYLDDHCEHVRGKRLRCFPAGI